MPSIVLNILLKKGYQLKLTNSQTYNQEPNNKTNQHAYSCVELWSESEFMFFDFVQCLRISNHQFVLLLQAL